jgi:L-ascorbate metabolism protein UlaG (beta-lactamase superfamily)
MFDIEYKGGNTIVVTTKKTSVVFDPRLSVVGLKDVVVKDGIQAATEARFATDSESYRLVIEGPGEYEIADVSLRGVAARRHIDTEADAESATVYQLEVAGIRVAVLGNIAQKLSEDQLEAIGVIDILIIPVGGNGYTLDATAAALLVRQLEPKAVVPVHYADSSLSYEVPQEALEVFTTELGAPVEDAGSKYKVKSAASLPQVLTVVQVARS